MRRYPTWDASPEEGTFWKLDTEWLKQRDTNRLARRKATVKRQEDKRILNGRITLR